MKFTGMLKISLLTLTLVFGSMAVAHADEADDLINEYTKVVEMYEAIADKDAVTQEDLSKFSESMMTVNQKVGTLQSSGKQMNQEQAQKLNDLAMRMNAVAQKISAKIQ